MMYPVPFVCFSSLERARSVLSFVDSGEVVAEFIYNTYNNLDLKTFSTLHFAISYNLGI